MVSTIGLLNVYAERVATDYLRNFFKTICNKNGIEMTTEMIDFHFQFANFVRLGGLYGYSKDDIKHLNSCLDGLIYEASLNQFASCVLRSCIERHILNNTLNEEGLLEVFQVYSRYVSLGCYEHIELDENELVSNLNEVLF